MTRERWGLAALVAGAAALRWIAWERTVAIFNDGPRFLAVAQAIDAGAWASALRDGFHPLYPAAAALAHRALPALGWEGAAALVSVVGGSAAVGFLFLFLRDAFGSPSAWVGAVLLAVHSRAVEYASDVQSDGLYLALFAAGLWLGWRALERRSAGDAAAAGAVSGLAYLTRPEGIGLALVLAALAALELVRRRWPLAAGLRWLAALALTAALAVVPYVVALERETGAWVLTQKKSVEAMLGAPPVASGGRALAGAPVGAAPEAAWLDPAAGGEDGKAVARAATPAARAWQALRMLARTARSALGYPIFALVLIGLAAQRGRPSERGRYVGAQVASHLALLYALTLGVGYVSRRHALPAVLPLFGYAGTGVWALGGALARGAAALRRAPARPAAGPLVAAVLAAVAIGEGARQLEPKRVEDRALRQAAEWLRDQGPGPGRVAAGRPRLGYYAGMPYVPLAGIAAGSLGPYLLRSGARYVIVDDPAQADALLRGEVPVRTLRHLEVEGAQAWVFELPADER